jgi:hypothetical protein
MYGTKDATVAVLAGAETGCDVLFRIDPSWDSSSGSEDGARFYILDY